MRRAEVTPRWLVAALIFLPLIARAGLFDKAPPTVGSCAPLAFAQKADAYSIDVDTDRPVRTLQGSFFGFNVEWIEFQLSMWDESRERVRADLVEALQPFAGAVYRYPGGGHGAANDLDWREANAPRAERVKTKRAGWTPPMALQFGVDEYLDFVADVGGSAWYIANLHGRESGELRPEVMADEMGALATKLTMRRATGKPAILRWELGNELDRSQWRWPPAKLAVAANLVASAIRKTDPKAQFVVLQQEYPTMSKEGFSQSDYNQTLSKLTRGAVSEFAAHIYYDGGRSEMPLPKKLLSMCAAISDARVARPDLKITPFWITETARVPEGMWDNDSKKVWTQTANLQAAISVADLYISASMIPEVQGAFLHSLHGTDGPWPLFHRSKDKSKLYPSALFLGIRMLRESMLPVVLQSRTDSRNRSGYDGGYDMHAVVMSDEARQRYSVWAVNRSDAEIVAPLRIVALRGKKLTALLTVLADQQLEANNYASPTRLLPRTQNVIVNFDAEGRAQLNLPAHAVYTLQMDTRKGV